MLKEIFHDSFENLNLQGFVWKTIQAWLEGKSSLGPGSALGLEGGGGDERCIYPVFCLFASLRSLVPGYGKSCCSRINASNFRPPLQSILHIRLKILRLSNFNMLFQAVLTIANNCTVFVFTESWSRDEVNQSAYWRAFGRRRYGIQPQETGHHGTADR